MLVLVAVQSVRTCVVLFYRLKWLPVMFIVRIRKASYFVYCGTNETQNCS